MSPQGVVGSAFFVASASGTVTAVPAAALIAGVGITITTSGGKASIAATKITLVTKTAAWTVALTTAGKLVTGTNASALAATIKKAATIAWPTGTVILFRQGGAGKLSLTAGATVTFHSATAKVGCRAEYSQISATYLGSNIWTLAGDLG